MGDWDYDDQAQRVLDAFHGFPSEAAFLEKYHDYEDALKKIAGLLNSGKYDHADDPLLDAIKIAEEALKGDAPTHLQGTHYWLNSKMSHFDWKLPPDMMPIIDHEVLFCMFCGAVKTDDNANAKCDKRPKRAS